MTAARVESSADDGSMRIRLSGEIDLANAAAVEDQIRAALTAQPSAVSVDLTDLTYLDSAGMRILYGLASRLHALRIVLELIVPLSAPTRRLIELSGFESIARVRPVRSWPYAVATAPVALRDRSGGPTGIHPDLNSHHRRFCGESVS
jgi:anti-anti-sigma factor